MIVDAYAHCGLTRHLPAERLVEAMNQAGVDACLLVQHMGEFDNGYLAAIVQRWPERFAAVGLVDTSKPDAAGRLHSLLSGAAGVSGGVRFLGTRMTAEMIDEAPACLAVLNENGATLVVHLPQGIGVHLALLDRVARDYPEVVVYVPHMGWPVIESQETPGWLQAVRSLARYPRFVFGLSAMYHFSSRPWPHEDVWPYVGDLVEVVGCQRLVWASDFPLLLGHESVSDYLRLFAEGHLQLTAGQREAILGETALLEHRGTIVKVTKVNTRLIGLGFRNCIVVEVHTDEGLVGLGETVLKRRSKTIEANIAELSRYLVGQDALRIEDHAEKMYRDSFWLGGPLHATAISVIDAALWDLQGKSLGVPVWRLLGGPTRDQIPVYCHCPAGETPERFVENLKRCRSWGYRAAKTTLPVFYGQPAQAAGVGYSGSPGAIHRSLRETEWFTTSTFARIAEFFAAGREAVGPHFEIAVDCHGRLNLSNAVQLCEALAPYHLLFIEEPTPPEDPAALREVASRTCTPIAAGERWATLYGVRPFLEAHSVGILQPDVANCGGITAAKKIAAMAESYYIPICPHNPNGPIATAMAAHLLAAIPNAFMLEMIGSPEDLALQAKMVAAPLRPTDGTISLPTGSGLGMELLPDAEKALPYQPFEGWR